MLLPKAKAMKNDERLLRKTLIRRNWMVALAMGVVAAVLALLTMLVRGDEFSVKYGLHMVHALILCGFAPAFSLYANLRMYSVPSRIVESRNHETEFIIMAAIVASVFYNALMFLVAWLLPVILPLYDGIDEVAPLMYLPNVGIVRAEIVLFFINYAICGVQVILWSHKGESEP